MIDKEEWYVIDGWFKVGQSVPLNGTYKTKEENDFLHDLSNVLGIGLEAYQYDSKGVWSFRKLNDGSFWNTEINNVNEILKLGVKKGIVGAYQVDIWTIDVNKPQHRFKEGPDPWETDD